MRMTLPNWFEHPGKVFLTKTFCLSVKNIFSSAGNVYEILSLSLIDDYVLTEGYSCYFVIKFQAGSLC